MTDAPVWIRPLSDGLAAFIHRLAGWDLQAMAGVRQAQAEWPAPVHSAVALLSHLGDRWFITALAVLAFAALALRGQPVRALAAGALLSGQGLLVWWLKDLAMRARPPQGVVDAAWGVVVNGYSLPSGHTTAATVAYGLLAWLALNSGLALGRAQRAAVITAAVGLALGIGVSRVLLGAHFPTDVLAGWCVGGAWLALSVVLLKALPPEQPANARRAGIAGPWS